jgi:uncharacterized protein
MKRLNFVLCTLSVVLIAAGSTLAQQPTPTEKHDLILKFRKLTGADNVQGKINVSFESIRKDLVAIVDDDKVLTDSQKQELRKSAIEAYDRLDKQLKDFLTEGSWKVSEDAIFKVYDQAFSEVELRELIAFYSTNTGQKALKFLPSLSAQVQQTMQAALLPMVQEFISPKIKAENAALKQRIEKAKTGTP